MLLNIQYIIDNLIKIYLLLIESYLFAGLNWFKIIPDLIEQAPNQILDVRWIESNTSAMMGNVLKPSQITREPLVVWNADINSLYTLLMVDPDDDIGDWLHWLVVDIPGYNVSLGIVKAGYMRSLPSEGSGLHRYTFLVYKQKPNAKFDDILYSEGNSCKYRDFDSRKFTKKYSLMDLVAINFVRAEYDESVAIYYRELKDCNITTTV